MALDYESIGLKAGLEIHRQLDTAKKLFCSCPTKIRDDQPDIIVKRKLRASAGEAGEVDVAAAFEQARNKHFIYQAYNDSTCAVELDEEPIRDLNPEALHISLQASALLKAKPVDRILVMRKTVVDGSNTSGFQRTALAARNGRIELLSGNVRIATICVEEESAKIVERTNAYDVYNLSRLGIPLVEIATEADIKSPEQLREAAEYIGMVLRSTKKVKRGLGTIRQDVNVSIREGERVEIKGAQDLRLLVKLVENEALRQKNLVEITRELKQRKAAVAATIEDVTNTLKSTESKLVKNVTSGGSKIKAVKLQRFNGLVGKEIQPGRRLGTELSDYAKAFGGVTGIIHSDELPKYGITEAEAEKIKRKLGCSANDAFAMVAAEAKKADAALLAVTERAKQAIQGVPKEVRKANADGTTTFLRPMPGSARMYPETDATTIAPGKKTEVPKLMAETATAFEHLGLSRDLANAVARSGVEDFFELMAEENPNLNNPFIAEILVSYAKEMERRKLDHSRITDGHIKQVFAALDRGKIAKESVMEALAEVAAGQPLNLEKYRTLTDAELEQELRKIISGNRNMPLNALIGKAMGKLRGKASGQKIVETLKKLNG